MPEGPEREEARERVAGNAAPGGRLRKRRLDLGDYLILQLIKKIGSLAAVRAGTDRHGRVIERNALVGIDAIFNTACVKGGVRDRETALSVDGKISLGVCLDLAAVRDVDIAAAPKGLTIG